MSDNKNKPDKNLVSILTTPLRVVESKALPILTAYSSLVEASKEGGNEQQIEKNILEAQAKVLEVKHNDAEQFEDFKVEASIKASGVSAFGDATPGSIVVIPVRGVMMRESSYSYSYGFIRGTRELEGLVKAAELSANVTAIVFDVKSPGGEAAGNESLARVIKSCSIPTLVSFEGLASAALEAFIGVDELYALEKDSYFGSLGTLTSVMNASKYWADMGVEIVDIYAPQSTLKNIESRAAKEGNIKPMQDRLEASTDFFINDVKAARPQIVDDGRIYKGALYNAVEAKKIKAIDGIKDLEYVINRAAFLARKQKRSNNSKLNSDMNAAEKAAETAAAEKLAADKAAATKEVETVEVSKEDKSILDTIKTALGLSTKKVETPVVDEAAVKAAADAQEVVRLTTLVGTHEKTIEAISQEKVVAETKASELEADLANLGQAKTVEGEEPIKTVAGMVEAYNATFEHNKALGGNGKAPATPVADQEGDDVSKVENNVHSFKSVEDREAEIEKALEAKRKAKKEANKTAE